MFREFSAIAAIRRRLISHLPASLCRGLIVEGVIDAGMVPKVEAALEALQSGVKKSPHCRCRHAARRCCWSFIPIQGSGTEIVPLDSGDRSDRRHLARSHAIARGI